MCVCIYMDLCVCGCVCVVMLSDETDRDVGDLCDWSWFSPPPPLTSISPLSLLLLPLRRWRRWRGGGWIGWRLRPGSQPIGRLRQKIVEIIVIWDRFPCKQMVLHFRWFDNQRNLSPVSRLFDRSMWFILTLFHFFRFVCIHFRDRWWENVKRR